MRSVLQNIFFQGCFFLLGAHKGVCLNRSSSTTTGGISSILLRKKKLQSTKLDDLFLNLEQPDEGRVKSCSPSYFPSFSTILSIFLYLGSFWLIISLLSHPLKHLSSRSTTSCIPTSDFLLEISQSQMNLLGSKLALPAWHDG